jgi:hypothetical protein
MTPRTGLPRWWGAACGLLAAAAAIGVGQLLAGFTVPAASPVVVVGGAAIDNTPLAVKEWATSAFGTADKTVLLSGVVAVVFLYSVVVGVLAMRRLALGFAGLALFAGIGLAAALTRHDATGTYAVPTIFGALAGAVALRWLVVTARRAAAAAQAGRAARAPLDASRLPPVAFGPDEPGAEGPADAGDGAGGPAGATSPAVPGGADGPGDSHWVDDSGWIAGSAGAADDGDDDSLGWVAAGRGAPGGSPAAPATGGTRDRTAARGAAGGAAGWARAGRAACAAAVPGRGRRQRRGRRDR